MKKMVKGEITVFLSLVFLLLLTLVGALLESASIQLAKNERRADAGRAVESAFAEYQKDLLERYGIFAIEGSYESGTMSEENILNRLSFYGAENIETEIAAIRYLTDQNGKEFLRQAVEYEKMKTGAAVIENLTGKVSEWKEQELKANEYGKENIETSKELDQMLESEKEELPAENNPLADIVDIQAQALLNLVSPEGFTLSSKAVKSEETVSNRKLRQGYGTMKEKDNGAGDTIFFNLYLIDKFGNAANKKKNTVLDYEMEYLLGGKASDKDNLEYVIGRIRILRFAVNYGYLLTDKDMQMEVDTLATTLSAVFLSPEIGPVIKHALLLAWAYGESLTDVKTLLAGKKVPAVKSKESWNLTLDGLLELAKNRSIPEGKETEEGNSYEQYLQMMLVLKSKEERSMFKMWWKIAKLAGLFFLGFGAAQDIKYQKISTEYLLAGSCAAILYRALFGRMHWSVWVAGLGCGIVFLMISKWSQEGIGYGDSWMILNMGIFLGIWNLLGMLMLAFLVAAMAAGAGLWSGKWKRTTRMSFYPFLLIGYLGTFIW